jgi:hypothetical protein
MLYQFFSILYIVATVRCCVGPPTSSFRRVKRQANNISNSVPIGTGDRFDNGNIVPRGLGSRSDALTCDIGDILSVKEIHSALKALNNEYGMEIFSPPHKTYEGNTVYGGKLGGTCADSYRTYFIAAIHARERGAPDTLIYFIADLLWAKQFGTGLTFGPHTYSNADVLKALSTGIVFLPLVNPDGVAWDQTTNTCWRKNRNPANAIPGNPRSIGVDLNRNFDFLWDFPLHYAPSAASDPRLASTNPISDVYHGSDAFSEPETKNVAWVLDQYPRVRWFLDIHSYSGEILYPWGDDNNQVGITGQNFRNSFYDGKRGILGDSLYGEWIDTSDQSNLQLVASNMATAMASTAGRSYISKQSVGLYPTSGSSDDYAFSRHYRNSALNKVYGFTMEFGFGNALDPDNCDFYPTEDQYRRSLLETGAGFMEFLLGAAQVGLGGPSNCGGGPGGDCVTTCTPGACGLRATCEVFNPDTPAPNFGKQFCFCQAGYKALGVADGDTSKHYHMTWNNANGGQTHRVAVNPGQSCDSLCGDVNCSEVPLKNSCR